MTYLIEDKDSLYARKGKDIFRMVGVINGFLDKKDFKGIRDYENRLLHELFFLKLRIDIVVTEDHVNDEELTNLKYQLSAINEILLLITRTSADIIDKNGNED